MAVKKLRQLKSVIASGGAVVAGSSVNGAGGGGGGDGCAVSRWYFKMGGGQASSGESGYGIGVVAGRRGRRECWLQKWK